MNAYELIDNKKVTRYFILDSHDTGQPGQKGHTYNDIDFVQYSYNPKQNNRISQGSAFLYRKPGADFKIIGGALISSIIENNNGFKTAYITNGFFLEKPLKKGDPFLENFQWENKKKPGPGWKGFWTNYGINPISQKDFWGLLKNSECTPFVPNAKQIEEALEDGKLLIDLNQQNYTNPSNHTLNTGPVKKQNPRVFSTNVYPRDRRVALNALNNANHLCEIDPNHATFLRRNSSIPYCEPHHLIPMCYQYAFANSLDVEENIVALCSNCHNHIHYGKDSDLLIKKLYLDRKKDLIRVGISIELHQLLSFYGLSEKRQDD